MAINIIGVSKKYGRKEPLREVDLALEDGVIYGLFGRNGAGKTTLLNIMTNRIFPTKGRVTIDGEDVANNDAAMSKMFMSGDDNLFDETLKLKRIVADLGMLRDDINAERLKALFDVFQIDERKRFEKLSTGGKTSFKNCLALASMAPVVIFDEPTLGLDAWARSEFYKQLLKIYAEEPKTYIISTHLIDEVADMVEHVVILKDGEIVENESCEELLRRGYTVTGAARVVEEFVAGKNVLGVDVLGGMRSAYVLEEDFDDVPVSLEVTPLNLQRLFVKLTENGDEER